MKKTVQTIAGLVAAEHSRSQVTRIIHAVGSDQKSFDELMRIFLGSDLELARRAAWSLGYIVLNDPKLVAKWFPQIITYLQNTNQHPAMYRNIFKFLQEIDIPEKYAARVLDLAYGYALEASHAIAVRTFALTTAWNISKKFPELQDELLSVIHQLAHNESPALRARIRHILAAINKRHKKNPTKTPNITLILSNFAPANSSK